MCGILFSTNPAVSTEAFRAALRTMDHRGPDASSVSEYGAAKLGHNRLKIMDLDNRSNQPFSSQDGRYVTVFNGEIYNFKELREKHRIPARTTSDTEILIELYAKLGPACLDEFYGMFAFVVLDLTDGSVFAARDRLGVKPLYYVETADGVSFSSELRALKEMHQAERLDHTGIRQYLKARAFFNGRTLYSDISMLPPGHYYQGGRTVKYWDLPHSDYTKSVSDEEIRAVMISAVDYRCISDVPVGSYLSGGLDSTIVAGLSSQPDTWTVGFADNNEFEWSRLAAKKFGCDHHEVLIDPEEFVELARFMVQHRGEPLSVPNEVSLYKMTKAVKEKNTVVLSGEGADELFFGYDRIFRWAAEGNWDIRTFDSYYSYGSHEDFEILEDILAPVADRPGALDKVAVFFQKHHLHGLLRRLDNSTMLCSVEARVPFVDHRFVELMYGVPASARMQDGIVKAPLKRAFADLVPVEIIERKKVGFPVPTDSIFSGRGTGMDRWLKFNMETLLGAGWDDIRHEITKA